MKANQIKGELEQRLETISHLPLGLCKGSVFAFTSIAIKREQITLKRTDLQGTLALSFLWTASLK